MADGFIDPIFSDAFNGNSLVLRVMLYTTSVSYINLGRNLSECFISVLMPASLPRLLLSKKNLEKEMQYLALRSEYSEYRMGVDQWSAVVFLHHCVSYVRVGKCDWNVHARCALDWAVQHEV